MVLPGTRCIVFPLWRTYPCKGPMHQVPIAHPLKECGETPPILTSGPSWPSMPNQEPMSACGRTLLCLRAEPLSCATPTVLGCQGAGEPALGVNPHGLV